MAKRLFELYALVADGLQAANSSGWAASALRRTERGLWTANLVHYPPNPAPRPGEDFGIADHSDWEAFTLLYPRYRAEDEDGNPHVDPVTRVAYTGLEAYVDHVLVQCYPSTALALP